MPALSSVQRGSRTITSGDGVTIDITITSVDTTRSIVMFTERNADTFTRYLRHVYSAYLSTGTNIRFERNEASSASSTVIEWTVVEFASGALQSLQTGSRDSTADPDDITVSSITTAQTFPLLTFKTSLTSFPVSQVPRPLLTSSTNLRLDFASAPTSGQFVSRWALVEFKTADATVQSGTIAITTAHSGTATITSVDTAQTLLAGFGKGTATAERGNARIYLSSATQVAANEQNYGSAESWNATWYAVEMTDGSLVQSGAASIADAATAPGTAPSWGTAMTNGAVFASGSLPMAYINAANDNSKPTDLFFTVALDSPQDSVTITRTGSTNGIELAWQVVEWAAAASGTTITPGSGSVTLTGAAPTPTKTANQWSAPGAGAVSLTGYAPGVQNGASYTVTPPAGAVTLAGAAPTVSNGASYTITPPAGAVTLAGAVPVQTLTLPAPAAGAIVLQGYAPTVQNGASYSVTPGAGSVVLSGAVPSVSATANQWLTPGAGSVVLTGAAPSVQNGQSYAVTPSAGSVTLAGAAPTVVRTANQWITPAGGAVVLSGAAPTATQAGSWHLTPGAGSIQITGYAPTVVGPSRAGAGRSTGSKRRRVVVRDRVYMVNERDIPALLEAELLDRAPPKTAEVVEGPKPRKRVKNAAQPIKTVEQVQEAVEQIKARIEPENAWLAQALEAVAYRVLERLQDEEDSIMLLVA